MKCSEKFIVLDYISGRTPVKSNKSKKRWGKVWRVKYEARKKYLINQAEKHRAW